MSEAVQAPEPRGSGRLGVPEAALALGMLALAAVAAYVGARITHIALDETLFKASAVRYGQGLPDTFLHDNAARASSRLYALTLMPIFKAFDGDVAVRVAKGFNAALWVSTAVPAYLIGLRVLRDRRAAALAALGGIAVPWVLLTTALFSEALAYPVTVWVAWAVLAAAVRPVWWRDALVILAIVVATGVRVQLVSLGLGYVVVAALACWLRTPPGGLEQRAIAFARDAVRSFPVLLLALVAISQVVLVLAVRNKLGHELDAGLGDYGSFDNRSVVPSRVGLGTLVQVLLIGLGVGVLPLVVALAWIAAALKRRAIDPEGWWFAVVAICLTAAVFAFTLAAQNGYLGPLTEERYFVYPVPLLWIAAVAGFREREAVQRKTILFVGLAFALLCTSIGLPRGLDPETGFLAPVSGLVSRGETVVLQRADDLINRQGLSGEDALLLVAALASVALWRLWDRSRGWSLVVGLGLPLVVQLGLVGYGLTAALGETAGGAGARDQPPNAAALGWIDRTLGDAGAQWLDNEPRVDGPLVQGLQRQNLFWNDRIGSRIAVSGAAPQVDSTPLDTLPLLGFVPDHDGEIGLPGAATVQWVDSPLVQLTGQRIAGSPDGHYELLRLAGGVAAHLRWLAPGLDPDGVVNAASTTRLIAWPQGGAAQVRLTLAPPPASLRAPGQEATPTRVRVRLGTTRRMVTLPAGGAPTVVQASVCGERDEGRLRVQDGVSTVDGRRTGAMLVAVSIAPGGTCG